MWIRNGVRTETGGGCRLVRDKAEATSATAERPEVRLLLPDTSQKAHRLPALARPGSCEGTFAAAEGPRKGQTPQTYSLMSSCIGTFWSGRWTTPKAMHSGPE